MRAFRTALAACAVASSLAAGAASAAITITFDAGFDKQPSYTEQGVTFTTVSGVGLWATASPNGTNALLSDTDGTASLPASPIRAVFDVAVGFLSLQIGDYAADEDTIYLRVFDEDDNLIGQTQDVLPSTLVGFKTLDITVAGIKYAVFGGIGRGHTSTVYIDNFTTDPTFNPPGAGMPGGAGPGTVPEPGSWALVILGFGAAGSALRRRRVAVA